jgi:hypothetical protein
MMLSTELIIQFPQLKLELTTPAFLGLSLVPCTNELPHWVKYCFELNSLNLKFLCLITVNVKHVRCLMECYFFLYILFFRRT